MFLQHSCGFVCPVGVCVHVHVCTKYYKCYDSLRKVAIKKKKSHKTAIAKVSLGTDSYLLSVRECIQYSPLMSPSPPIFTFEGRYFHLKTVKSGLLFICYLLKILVSVTLSCLCTHSHLLGPERISFTRNSAWQTIASFNNSRNKLILEFDSEIT